MRSPSRNFLQSALVAACSLLLAAGLSPGAVVYSGLLGPGGTGLPIPTTFNGIYLNLESSSSSEPGDDPAAADSGSYTIGYSEPADWDVNFFFGGIGVVYSPTFQPLVDDTVTNRSQILNVTGGTVISAAAALQTLGVAAYGGSGRPNGSTRESHFDTPTLDLSPAYAAFTPGAEGYIAFVLNPGGSEQYGWMRVTLTNDGTPGKIHAWAYSDDAGFKVGQIPEPDVVLLLAVGSLGLLRRRRAAQG